MIMFCPRCNVKMNVGQAIKTEPSSIRLTIHELNDLISPKDLKIKCPECGHSDDGEKVA